MLKIYPEVVGYLHQTHATDDVTAKTDAALTRYTETLTMQPAQHGEALVIW